MLLLRSAFGAELCAGLHFCAAVFAEFFGAQWLAAFLAEFAAPCFRAAMRACRHDGLLEFVGGDIIHTIGFFARVGDRGLHLNGRHFFLQIGRAIFAETALGVPAIAVHPMTTAFAFVEMRLGILHGRGDSQ